MPLQLGVVHKVLPAEGLLDHHQVKSVKRLEMLEVVKCVGGVRVGHQSDAGKLGANVRQDFHVPARLDLDLDALVAGGELALDLFEQFIHRVLDADRNAARDLVEGASHEFGQRETLLLRFDVPQRVFERGFGHVVAADGTKLRRYFTGARPFPSERPRDEEVAEDVPRGLGRLVAVERGFAGRYLAPARQFVCFGADQDDPAFAGSAKACLKEVDQRQADFPELDAVNLHTVFRQDDSRRLQLIAAAAPHARDRENNGQSRPLPQTP